MTTVKHLRHRARVGLVGLLLCLGGGLLACCLPAWMGTSSSPSWKPVGSRFDRRSPEELAVAGDSALFTRECPDMAPTLGVECTEVWRLHGSAMREVQRFPAAVVHLSGQGSTWFVMLSLPVPGDRGERRYQLVRSTDDGLTWEDRGDVVGRGPLLVLSASEVWILSNPLVRSADGGLTFQGVTLPGERDASREQLSQARNGDVLLTGPHGLFRLGREGVLGAREGLEGWTVTAAAGGYFVGHQGGALASRKDEPGAAWIPFKQGTFNVAAMAADGEVLRVVTQAVEPSRLGSDLQYHVSRDGGRTWTHEDTGLLKATLSGRTMGAAWNYVGQLYTCASP